MPGVVAADAARNGCPPTPALVKLTDQKIELLQAIRFETGKDLITADSEPILREVAAVLAAHPEMARVRVEGHTDGRGSVASNTALSDRRARAVKAWLVKVGGIDAARLEAKGYGPAQPIATNDTPEGRALNRRVEFAIVSRP